jgi:hypothetical protein
MNKTEAIIKLTSFILCLFVSLSSASARGTTKDHPGDEGSPQKSAFDQMKAQFSAQIEEHQIDSIAGVLISEPYEGASWQAAAFALDEYFQRQAPLPAHAPLLQRAFSASIKPKDHWLLYDNIVNYQTPYRLRRQLANCLTILRTGQPGRTIPEVELLSENPSKWLEKWGVLSVAAQPAAVSPAKGAALNVEIKQGQLGPEVQALPVEETNLQPSGDAESMAWVWLLIGFGGIGLVCLLWRFLK